MPTHSFDVVIIGGGNAGMGVTVATREAGLKVAMIEPDLLGGTCPNRGCMPKKVLGAAAHALDEIERANAHHIAGGPASRDWAALIDREKAMIAGTPATILETLPRLIGNLDFDAVAQLHAATERIGGTIHTGVGIQRIERAGDRVRVVYQEGGSEQTVEAERVVNGAGRVADVDG